MKDKHEIYEELEGRDGSSQERAAVNHMRRKPYGGAMNVIPEKSKEKEKEKPSEEHTA